MCDLRPITADLSAGGMGLTAVSDLHGSQLFCYAWTSILSGILPD